MDIEGGNITTIEKPTNDNMEVDHMANEEEVLEAKVEGEDLNMLGMVMKQTIDRNLRDPKKSERVKKLEGTMVVRASDNEASCTVHFRHGDIKVHNGPIDDPDVQMKGSLENLAKVNTAQIGSLRAALTRKVSVKGNVLKALKMSVATVRKPDPN